VVGWHGHVILCIAATELLDSCCGAMTARALNRRNLAWHAQ